MTVAAELSTNTSAKNGIDNADQKISLQKDFTKLKNKDGSLL